ncbi:hypothetical protein B0A48_08357 [Cryoendolithus antarcticus]|uniref:UBC core domain-containing protein n=1 Tax=Cryoendolithus antarcticus TaxID=1507870 RepID=A0A1V8T5K0_9PEZI|nr:hypothetical protein B0A48_08357 [Cryoendolithus antarcticus]
MAMLCTEDIVAKKGSTRQPGSIATVERTVQDSDTHLPGPFLQEEDPIGKKGFSYVVWRKFSTDGVPPQGTVLIRWVRTDRVELIREDELEILHRQLYVGDVVMRGPGSTESGVVMNVNSRCSLLPMGTATVKSNGKALMSLSTFDDSTDLVRVSKQPPHLLDVPVSELQYEESPAEDDMIVYKGWLGKVLSMSCHLSLRLTDNSVVEVDEEVVELLSQAFELPRIGDVVKTKKANLRTGVWKFGKYNANVPPVGTVVSSRPVSIEVGWVSERLVGSIEHHEPPNVLERDEFESEHFKVYDRSRKPAASMDLPTVSNSEIEITMGLRVRFRDLAGAAVKYDGASTVGKIERIPRQDTLGYDMNVFEVSSVSATVSIQWQDLSITTEPSIALIPDTAIDDEHAAWPGEAAHTLASSKVDGLSRADRVGIIQSVKAAERMALIRWCPDASVAYTQPDTITEDGDVAEMIEAVVATATGETAEVSLYDLDAAAELNVRRGDVVLLDSGDVYRDLSRGPSDVCWLGEVVDTQLDGLLLIRLGVSDEVRDVALQREHVHVVIRSDGTDVLDDGGEDDADEEDSDWDMETDSEGDDAEEVTDEEEVVYQDENGDPMDIDEAENEDWESDEGGVDVDTDIPEGDLPPAVPVNGTSHETSTSNGVHSVTAHDIQPDGSARPTEPPPYLILSTPIPASHHFATQPSSSNPATTKRIGKEHRIISSSDALPQGVYVRSWDSRLDLFRVLFIGPLGTPYASAPFIIDFYLPTDYPHAPPQAHFHSWPGESGLGGTGGVNPNLYETGKICLSLLGTWESGAKTEGWNSSKSTLLQVVVSILGLVLVPEPYFNEAGYEPLAGQEGSKRPSALYNERTFLRANGFVIGAVAALRDRNSAALLSGMHDLQEELRWLYLKHAGPGLLDVVIERVEGILERSRAGSAEVDGSAVMSKGATIPLSRIATRLRSLTEA